MTRSGGMEVALPPCLPVIAPHPRPLLCYARTHAPQSALHDSIPMDAIESFLEDIIAAKFSEEDADVR